MYPKVISEFFFNFALLIYFTFSLFFLTVENMENKAQNSECVGWGGGGG